MVGSCTNSTAFADSCWNSIYGPIDMHSLLIIGGFLLFILLCIGFSLPSWVKLLDIKKGKKKQEKRVSMSWPLWILMSTPFFLIVFLLITDGLKKSGIFAFYNVIGMATFGIAVNIYRRHKYPIQGMTNKH